jgi:single-strand DNA-binding protein
MSFCFVGSPENIIRTVPPTKHSIALGSGGRSPFGCPKTLEADRNQLKGEHIIYLNQLTIIGFTGQDADFHFSSNGTPVTTLSVATKESWKDAAGDWQSHTEWHRIVAFGKLAEYAKTLTKGTHVMVQGSLRSREYEKDGVSRRVSEVRAETIAKLDRVQRGEAQESPES